MDFLERMTGRPSPQPETEEQRIERERRESIADAYWIEREGHTWSMALAFARWVTRLPEQQFYQLRHRLKTCWRFGHSECIDQEGDLAS